MLPSLPSRGSFSIQDIIMSKTRIIQTRFWSDNYTSNLDPIEKLLFLYFLTNSHTEICGVYEIPLKIIAIETGLDKEMVEKILKRFSNDKKVFYIDGWLWVTNFTKHQVRNPNIEQGIKRCFNEIPNEITKKIHKLLEATPRRPLGDPQAESTKLNLTKLNLYVDRLMPTTYQESLKESPIHKEIIELINYYKELYIKHISPKEPIISWAKCIKLTKPYLKKLGLPRMKALVEAYLASENKFYRENTWNLELFLKTTVINQLHQLTK